MPTPEKKSVIGPAGEPLDVGFMFEAVFGCKWSLHVLGQIRKGVHRPGQIRDAADGLSDKVLNERLNKLLRFGVIERGAYPEAPPRVEYTLTDLGQRFVGVLDQIEALRRDLATRTDGG